MSKLRIVVLETDDADASTVVAIGNMIREMQSTRGVTSVEHVAEPRAGEASGGPPPALPAAKRVYKPRVKASKGTAAGGRCRKCGETGHNARTCAKP